MVIKRCANCRGIITMKKHTSRDGQRYHYVRCNRCMHENYVF
ncbi:hypothetical protein PU629_02695 [Pullulanibacillus sp. KACC 23026]|nr:hypothetical protein [Pullulanibacillus sp. KACC 23026]WEG13291.1 hypothetical protein PU629_02695 [Pullulanibacillus sp. KACC 23026]